MSDTEQAICDTVCDIDGCVATIDAMIDAITGDCYDKFDKQSSISVLFLLRKNLDEAGDRIRDL